MFISCEQYEAPCFLSSVGSEHLVYTERVTGSNPVESTVGAQRTHDLVRDLFSQTRYLKLSGQSTGLALCPGGGIGIHGGLRTRLLRVRVSPWVLYMVVIVLMVSTSDCDSASMGSSPINHPKLESYPSW